MRARGPGAWLDARIGRMSDGSQNGSSDPRPGEGGGGAPGVSGAPPAPFSPVAEVLEELRAGRMIILTDDEDRENEGDLVLPARFATPESINFMLREAKGYLCLSLTEADCDRLRLDPQATVNTSVRGTPFTVSIDGHPDHGFTTGVSASERARCIRMAIDPSYGAGDFVRPGHINPLRSRDGGVLVRTGQTEGSVDLCRLAGLYPAAVIIEITRDDGEMARLDDLEGFARRHDLKICSVNQLIEYRLRQTTLVRRLEPLSGVPIETEAGRFTVHSFRSDVDSNAHLALCAGGVGDADEFGHVRRDDEPVLVRVQRQDLLGDLFSMVDDPGGSASSRSIHAALRAIAGEGRGVFLYMRTDGVGDDVALRRKALGALAAEPDHRQRAIDTEAMPMDRRNYGIGGQILKQLGVNRMRLLTNTPRGLPGLSAFGLEITEHVPLV